MTPSQRKIEDIAGKLLAWFSQKARDLPWRRTRDPYAIWVSEIMLQQTQVKTVLPYWHRWMQSLPTIQSLANADSQTLHKLWEGLGYYTRVRNLQKAAQLIISQHDGRFPSDFDAILELPGIGPYTAGAIASIAFSQPQPILDGNVIRVLTRLFGITANVREKSTNARLWEIARQLVEQAKGFQVSSLNQSLMELGALVCTPKKPSCPACPLQGLCIAHRTALTDSIPRSGPRPPTTQRRFSAFVIEYRKRFLIRQRPAGVVNAHLWEFPNAEIPNAQSDPSRAARAALGFTPRLLTAAGSFKHCITRYQISVQVYRATPGKSVAGANGKWYGLKKLESLPFTAAHRRILKSFASK